MIGFSNVYCMHSIANSLVSYCLQGITRQQTYDPRITKNLRFSGPPTSQRFEFWSSENVIQLLFVPVSTKLLDFFIRIRLKTADKLHFSCEESVAELIERETQL